MRIGIDIDDVITNTSELVRIYVEKNDNNGDLKNYMEDIMKANMVTPKIEKFFEENAYNIFRDVNIKENAVEIIKKLLNSGNEVYIITSRGEICCKGSEKLTYDYFKKNNINYTKIFFDSFEKAKICKENKIDIMIDDSVKHCREIADKNIKSILFTSEVNKDILATVPRVSSWLELEEKINEINN